MHHTMMNYQLSIRSLMEYADKVHGNSEIVSVTADNSSYKYTYRDAFSRVRKLATALENLGAKKGDAIATLAWNDHRHFELYYAISCSGMVCHTINPKLFPEQVEFIANHANDRWIFLDVAFVPLIEELQDKLPNVEGYVILTDEKNMPDTQLRNVFCYEELVSKNTPLTHWPELDENTAASMCYTSGTTGNPKGVVYSHRSTLLHVYASTPAFGITINTVLMPVVPMFHVNAWGFIYSAPMAGAKLVLPGPNVGDGESLAHLINDEKVTLSAGVPTVWLALMTYLETTKKSVPTLERLVVGGAACPRLIIETFSDKYNVDVNHAWGMTEMSPLGAVNLPSPMEDALPEETYMQNRLKQGRPVFGVDMRIEDDEGNELPWDGKAFGALKVRGPWVAQSYYGTSDPCVDEAGWLDTGDVATITSDGLMQITDRKKDVIKSGGEWISSIDLENCALDNPKVSEAAVVGISHPKWSERPLLFVVLKEGIYVEKQEILSWFNDKVAKWWIPSGCVFVDKLPHTATGKIDKKVLREKYSNFSWDDEQQ